MNCNLVLFEDHCLADMSPVTLTRPAFAVTCVAYNLYDVARMASGRLSYIVRDYLAKSALKQFPSAAPGAGPTLFLNASVVPDVRYAERIRKLMADGRPFLCPAGQRAAAALLPAGTLLPQGMTAESVTPFLLNSNLPLAADEPFALLDYPFQIIAHLKKIFPENIRLKAADGKFRQVQPGVYAGKEVQVPPTAVFHAEQGPIVLDDGVRILDFTYFQGPLYIGPRSRVIEHASVKEFSSIGHTCKVGGEVECSIIEAYSNKQHHGFLGHAYIGSWVNLGAGTSNSDLKNTYGEIRIEHRGRRLDTGMQFFGCAIGDFSKSAINTSIFTGKIIGVSSMLYGYVSQNVPSFCNYAKSFGQVTECTLEQAIVTQKRMFARRNVQQTEEDVALLTRVFDMTRDERTLSAELPVL